jgi:hypothetical protein
MRFSITFLFILLSAHCFAQNWAIKAPLNNFEKIEVIQNLESKLFHLLPPAWHGLKSTPIKFVTFKNDNTQARYNKLTKSISVSNSLLSNEEKLLKTVLHELAHAYEDQINKVSNQFSFQQLVGWHKRGLIHPIKKRKNFAEERSPDHYEFKNHSEAFAVNMEYFLTDPTFACRRPSLFNYLVTALNFTPKKVVDCKSTNLFPVYTNGVLDVTSLDSSRLYEIHYLLADKGSAVESRMGHSMLRLIFCSPKRAVMNADCVKDVDHHIVLSYRANVQDLTTNYIKGLLGKYNSQVFLYTMFSVIDEYTRLESRNLISYPLLLSQEQKKTIFDRVKEEVWSYRGKYRFLSQNCATETSDFIKTLVPTKKALKIHVRTPRDVYRKYKKIGVLADIPVEDDKKIQAGYYFESKKARFENYYTKLLPYTSVKSFDDYLNHSSASERQQLFKQIKNQEKSLSLAATMLILEKHIHSIKKMELGKVAMTRLMNESPELTSTYREMLNNYLEGRLKISENKMSYGIPLQEEILESTMLPPSLLEILDQFKEWIEKHYQKELTEIEHIQYNLEVFRDFITTPL